MRLVSPGNTVAYLQASREVARSCRHLSALSALDGYEHGALPTTGVLENPVKAQNIRHSGTAAEDAPAARMICASPSSDMWYNPGPGARAEQA